MDAPRLSIIQLKGWGKIMLFGLSRVGITVIIGIHPMGAQTGKACRLGSKKPVGAIPVNQRINLVADIITVAREDDIDPAVSI